MVKAGGRGNNTNSQEKQSQNNTAQRHMSTITHLVLSSGFSYFTESNRRVGKMR
jgi:hypothetical protein